ncbi:MAG: hypothetical protein D6812_11910 [Deltaproteobacteria bacterium]|nr:MAG: hypothetical protein D6812_11910 [Deltaproteobacteria bacterium]
MSQWFWAKGKRAFLPLTFVDEEGRLLRGKDELVMRGRRKMEQYSAFGAMGRGRWLELEVQEEGMWVVKERGVVVESCMLVMTAKGEWILDDGVEETMIYASLEEMQNA